MFADGLAVPAMVIAPLAGTQLECECESLRIVHHLHTHRDCGSMLSRCCRGRSSPRRLSCFLGRPAAADTWRVGFAFVPR